MREIRFLLQPEYVNSRALIIGIDKYKYVSPLSYAVSDAEEVKQILEKELGFPAENTVYLTNKQATQKAILKEFIGLTDSTLALDERVFVFFAGHGHTRTGIRGEVGYLVPYDGNTNDYATLIRWDELTRNADLVRQAEAGESIVDPSDFPQTPEANEHKKIEALAEIICAAGDEASGALLVLMGTLQDSTDPKSLANTAKHFAFTRCGELNAYGMVDEQIAVIERELFRG